MKRKPAILFSILLFALLFAAGCAPKGDPSEIINAYYQNIRDNDFDSAYACLAAANHKQISKSDFELYQQTRLQISDYKGCKIKEIGSRKNIDIDGVTYKDAVQFKITETAKAYYNNKVATVTNQHYAVNDDGKWKFLRKKQDIKARIAANYSELGWMFTDGKGKDLDLNEAAMCFNQAIEQFPECSDAYYGLGHVYNEQARYEESTARCNEVIKIAEDLAMKSDAYNLIGLNYLGVDDTANAQMAFSKALELNPGNEYAKTNLADLQ